MTESIFERAGGDVYVPTEAALGPWSDQAMHGGPPAMLLARSIERFQPDIDMVVTRLTIELLRPVGRTPLVVRCRVVRPGRKVRLLEASLWREEDEVARATALLIRRAPPTVDLPELVDPPVHTLGEASGRWEGVYRSGPAYHKIGVEIRTHPEAPAHLAPGWAWIRLRLPLVPEEEPSALVRVCSVADFPNGVSYIVDPRKVSYINPDMTIYLNRLPIGEWVLVDARSWLHPGGAGVAEGALYDEHGRIGRSMQALLVQPATDP